MAKSGRCAGMRTSPVTRGIAATPLLEIHKDGDMQKNWFLGGLLLVLAAGPAYPQNKDILRLQEDLSWVRSQMNSLSQQVMTIKTTSEPLATPNDLWKSAMLSLFSGLYDLAVGDFQEFLSKSPNDPRAPEAHLRMGEAFFNQKKYQQAETEYDFVLQKYPESDTTRAALLKKGLALAEHDTPQAITTLNEVVKKFPNTSEANSAQTKLRELQSARRPAR